jgi:hypothetical protein
MREVEAREAAHLNEEHTSSTSDQKRELTKRVIDSQVFSRSPAMRAFLLFIAEHAILGRTERLKEQTIGAEVLGRKPNYDPADDNIVRVRAHELRGRLERYFSSEGLEEPVIITIPKGSYVPEFVPRPVAVADAPVAPPPPEDSTTERTVPPLTRYWLPFAAVILLIVAASVGLTRYALKDAGRAGSVTPSGALRDFWGQFFDRPDQELKVVYADTSFALWQDLNGKDLNLGDYLSHKYLQVPDDKFREVAMRRSTSPADLSISVRLAFLTEEFGGRMTPLSARSTDIESLQHGNAVVIGSHRSNPWVEVFEPNLNFTVQQDPHSGAPLFKNRSPQAHETPSYAIPEMLDEKGAEQREFTSYGLVALVRGCNGRGLAVLVEGLNMQATQAAGDIVSDNQRLDTLLHAIGHKPGTNVAPFEALIQVTSLPGGYTNPELIAFRLSSANPCRVR